MPLEILHRAAPCRNVPITFTLHRMNTAVVSSTVVESLSRDERELWAQACRLWEQSRGDDRAGIWAAIHPRYVGWDMSTDLPHDKEAAVASVTGHAPALKEYDLFPHSVRIYDNVVGVVHYSYRATVHPHGAASLRVTGKWTEVYLKQENEWRMISVSGIPKPSPNERSPASGPAA